MKGNNNNCVIHKNLLACIHTCMPSLINPNGGKQRGGIKLSFLVGREIHVTSLLKQFAEIQDTVQHTE